MREKRSHPRFNTVIKVQDMNTLKTGWTQDLSPGGCLIKKSEELDFLPMASKLTLKLEIPGVDETIIVKGIVRQRGKHREGFGIQFDPTNKKSIFYIERFLGTFL